MNDKKYTLTHSINFAHDGKTVYKVIASTESVSVLFDDHSYLYVEKDRAGNIVTKNGKWEVKQESV